VGEELYSELGERRIRKGEAGKIVRMDDKHDWQRGGGGSEVVINGPAGQEDRKTVQENVRLPRFS
jgi:hypothetical protein